MRAIDTAPTGRGPYAAVGRMLCTPGLQSTSSQRLLNTFSLWRMETGERVVSLQQSAQKSPFHAIDVLWKERKLVLLHVRFRKLPISVFKTDGPATIYDLWFMTGNTRDECAAVHQVLATVILQTPAHWQSEFVLDSLQNVEPVMVGVQQMWWSPVKLACTTDKSRCRFQHSLQLLGGGFHHFSHHSISIYLTVPVHNSQLHNICRHYRVSWFCFSQCGAAHHVITAFHTFLK